MREELEQERKAREQSCQSDFVIGQVGEVTKVEGELANTPVEFVVVEQN